MQRHLISAADLTRDDAILILDTAERWPGSPTGRSRELPTLRGVPSSTSSSRTRRGPGSPSRPPRSACRGRHQLHRQGLQRLQGRSLQGHRPDAGAMSVDAVVIRHSASGAPYRQPPPAWIDAHVVNAGDSTHQHRRPAGRLHHAPPPGRPRRRPRQDLDGRRITLVGDILQPGRPLQRRPAAHPRRRVTPRPAPPCCRSASGPGLQGAAASARR